MRKDGEVGMSERPEKRRIEFIESYWTGGELGSDYQWNDNHGELVRCKDCRYCFVDGDNVSFNMCLLNHSRVQPDDWYCADGKRKE